MSVSRSVNITLDNALVERCDSLRLDGQFKRYSLKRFRELIINMGIEHFLRTFPQSGKTIEKTPVLPLPVLIQPEIQQRNNEKIICFPGVTLSEDNSFQDMVEDFMRDQGWID
jgi:hypothetical protein